MTELQQMFSIYTASCNNTGLYTHLNNIKIHIRRLRWEMLTFNKLWNPGRLKNEPPAEPNRRKRFYFIFLHKKVSIFISDRELFKSSHMFLCILSYFSLFWRNLKSKFIILQTKVYFKASFYVTQFAAKCPKSIKCFCLKISFATLTPLLSEGASHKSGHFTKDCWNIRFPELKVLINANKWWAYIQLKYFDSVAHFTYVL